MGNGEEEEEESDAEREWKESLQQLELLLTMVVVPYVGKYFGRKCAYWGKSRLSGRGGRAKMGREEGRGAWGRWLLICLFLGKGEEERGGFTDFERGEERGQGDEGYVLRFYVLC